MKKVFLFLVAGCCLLLNQNLVVAQRSTASAGSGEFEIRRDNQQAVQMYYSLRTAQPGTLVLQLRPSSAIAFSARIINEQGIEKMHLDSYSGEPRYVKVIDVSALAKGNYFVQITESANGRAAAAIPFSK